MLSHLGEPGRLEEVGEEVVSVLDDCSQQADLEHVGWQVVVQEQRPLHQEVREVVKGVADAQHLQRQSVFIISSTNRRDPTKIYSC